MRRALGRMGPTWPRLCGLSLVLASLSPSSAAASLPELFGLGGRVSAMANTGAAYATGFDAAYANPAGLWQSGRQLTLGTVYGGYGLSLRSPQDGNISPHVIDPTAGLIIGGSFTLPLGGVLKDRIGTALALYTPFGLINRAQDPFPDVPRAPVLDGRSQVVSVLLGAGVRLPGGFSVGGGALALAALVGTITITPDGSGRIVNIASVLALFGVPDATAYCAAKHAVLGFTRALSKYAAPRGITVNAICPGWTRTQMAEERMAALGLSQEQLQAGIPLGQMVEPEEVAALVELLVISEAGRKISGQALTIDGGSFC